MFKKKRYVEPQEATIVRNGKEVSEWKPKIDPKKKATRIIGFLFFAGVAFMILYFGKEAEAKENVFQPRKATQTAMAMPTQTPTQPPIPTQTPTQPPVKGELWQGFHPEVLRWERKILIWAQRYNMDPNLIATIMQIESCGWQHAQSGSGALGLFQVMPYHFKEGEDPFKPGVNARRGLTYFKGSLKKADGNLKLAFAGYNGGHGVINWDKSHWPSETVRYAKWGRGIMNDIASGAETSQTLKRWYENGGNYLCQQAAQGNK